MIRGVGPWTPVLRGPPIRQTDLSSQRRVFWVCRAQVWLRGTAYSETFLGSRRGGTPGRPGLQVLLTFLQPCRGGPRGRLSGWLLPNLSREILGPFAGSVWVTMEPSSAPFGGTFPLVGGRLCGRPRCTAPTARTKQQGDRDRAPHPSGLAASHLPPEEGFAGGSWTRPYGGYRSDCVVLVGAGPRPARQDLHRERWLGKARRRSGTAPVLIFANPGPSGPAGI